MLVIIATLSPQSELLFLGTYSFLFPYCCVTQLLNSVCIDFHKTFSSIYFSPESKCLLQSVMRETSYSSNTLPPTLLILLLPLSDDIFPESEKNFSYDENQRVQDWMPDRRKRFPVWLWEIFKISHSWTWPNGRMIFQCGILLSDVEWVCLFGISLSSQSERKKS